MGLSSKIKYGSRLMIALSFSHPDNLVSVRRISDFSGVSAKYLEQIIPELKDKGLLTSIQGKYGGYMLTKKPEDISLFDIYSAFSKKVLIDKSIKDKGLELDKLIWEDMEDSLIEKMKSLSLEQLKNTFLKNKGVSDFQV